MIKNRLKILLAERDLNYSKLSEMSGISINALLVLPTSSEYKYTERACLLYAECWQKGLKNRMDKMT